ncbi:YacL family protein [Hyalangium versicolor]|uniref:YacL family protein n=1 Tax=Hyalangium versicolor TaxID=2861190 RepID=UPI001CCDC6E7|nr:YacL family protein [Hyalangium versicolor]
MHKLRFTWDQEGHVQALGEPPDDVLAHYLSEEVRNDPRRCKRLLDIIRALRRGSHSSWLADGESWSVKLSRGRAIIESEIAVPGRVREVTLEEFEEMVESWLRFLETVR